MEQVFQKLRQLMLFHKVGDHKARRRALAIGADAVGLPQRAFTPYLDDAAVNMKARVRGFGHGAYPSACCRYPSQITTQGALDATKMCFCGGVS